MAPRCDNDRTFGCGVIKNDYAISQRRRSRPLCCSLKTNPDLCRPGPRSHWRCGISDLSAPDQPSLGARAMYFGGAVYRIHGTTLPARSARMSHRTACASPTKKSPIFIRVSAHAKNTRAALRPPFFVFVRYFNNEVRSPLAGGEYEGDASKHRRRGYPNRPWLTNRSRPCNPLPCYRDFLVLWSRNNCSARNGRGGLSRAEQGRALLR
jgi:hypothetical protein